MQRTDSGVFGGTVHEPMIDLFHLFTKLVSPQGEILVPGIEELVDPLTEQERYVGNFLNSFKAQ